jgi:hypothetical protein
MKISSKRVKQIIQEEIYNIELEEAEAVDLKQMATDKMKQVATDIKDIEPILNKIVDMVDKAAMDAADNDKGKAAEYKTLIAQAIQGT